MAARLASSGFRSLDEALLADGTLPPTSEGIDYMARVLGPCLLLEVSLATGAADHAGVMYACRLSGTSSRVAVEITEVPIELCGRRFGQSTRLRSRLLCRRRTLTWPGACFRLLNC